MSIHSKIAIAALSCTALTMPCLAHAQDGRLEELVVTARKREENVLKVPMAISALSRRDLEASSAQNITDLSKLTPGFVFTDQAAFGAARNDRSYRSLAFRGINPNGNQEVSQTGMLFLDGAPVFNADLGGLTDIERVEVLKGPQNAYFGRSVIAGAINLITRDPAQTFGVKIAGEYSSYGSNDQSLSVEGPLIAGKLSGRLGLHHMYKGGQYTNAANTGEKFGRRETNSVSATLLATPTDKLRVRGFATYFVDDDGTPSNGVLLPSEGTCNAGALLVRTNNYWCGVAPQVPAGRISMNTVIDPRTYNLMLNNSTGKKTLFDPHFLEHFGLRREAFQTSLNITYDLPYGITFNSITAYHKAKFQVNADTGFRDTSSIPNPNFPAVANAPQFLRLFSIVQARSWDISQELRLTSAQDSRFRWLAGYNYSYIYDYSSVVWNLGSFGVTQASDTGTLTPSTHSVFGAAFYDLTSRLTLSAEGRYQIDQVENAPPQLAAPLRAKFRSFNPRISLDYKITENTMVYALWSRGSRPGGFNSLFVGQPASVLAQVRTQSNAGITYEEERLDNYEVGVKSTLFDGRVQGSIAVYIAKYDNQRVQQNVFFTNASGGTATINAVTNAGASDLSGVEAEGRWQVNNRLLVSASYAFNNTEFKAYDCISCMNFINGTSNQPGNMFPNTPKMTGSVVGTYTAPLVQDWNWFARGEYFYKSTVYGDETNIVETGPQSIVNFKVGVAKPDITLEAFVKNVTDDDTYLSIVTGRDSISGTQNRLVVALPDKRTFGARASFSF